MAQEIEFFFDVGSPYSYLASTQLAGLSERTGCSVRWRPFLLGGVFKAAGNTMPGAVAAKAQWMLGDLKLWSKNYDVPFNFSPHFPLNTIQAQRALSFQEIEDPAGVSAFAEAIFRGFWVDGENVSDPEVIRKLADRAKADHPAVVQGDRVIEGIGQQETKDRLRATTDEAVSRGAFGAPTFVVAERLFWGNDRLPQVEQAAKG
ncbi:MAG: 2-hydroxychromene-2-carboxylate isomerase [Myxococcota bacterium]